MHPAKKVLDDYLNQGRTVAYDEYTAENKPDASNVDISSEMKKFFPSSLPDDDKKKKVG